MTIFYENCLKENIFLHDIWPKSKYEIIIPVKINLVNKTFLSIKLEKIII